MSEHSEGNTFSSEASAAIFHLSRNGTKKNISELVKFLGFSSVSQLILHVVLKGES